MYNIYENLRNARGMTDYSVAKNSGVARSVLYEWKVGKHTPNLENMKKLARFFGVTVDYLIGK